MSAPKQIVVIAQKGTGKVVKQSDVTGWPERRIDKLMDGMSINLDHDQYYIAQREIDADPIDLQDEARGDMTPGH